VTLRNYWAEPHATVSRQGDRILFGSNWRQDVAVVTNVDAYVCEFAQLIPPALECKLSGGHWFLSWPALDASYTLESTTALDPSGWGPAPEHRDVQGNRITVTVDFLGNSRFFRLRK
jgi:hypothetical protein